MLSNQDYEPPPATPPGSPSALSRFCAEYLCGYSTQDDLKKASLKILEGLAWIYSPICNSFYEMAITSLSLKKWEDQEHIESLSLMVAVSIFAYMQSFALNGKRSINNVKELYKIIKDSTAAGKLTLPVGSEDWPVLNSRWKEYLALGIYIPFTICLTGSDFFGGKFFTKNAPNDFGLANNPAHWDAFCFYIATVAASTTCMTEGYEIWISTRKAMFYLTQLKNGNLKPFTYPKSFAIAALLGIPLAALGGIGVLAETYTSVVSDDTLNITSETAKKTAFYLCIPKAVGDMCFSRTLMIKAIYNFNCKISDCRSDGFFNTVNAWSHTSNLSWRKPQMWLLSAVLLSSFGMAGLVFFSQYAFTDEILENPKTALPYSWSDDYWFDTLTGIGTMIGDIITQATELVNLIWNDVPQDFLPLLKSWFFVMTTLLCCKSALTSSAFEPLIEENAVELATVDDEVVVIHDQPQDPDVQNTAEEKDLAGNTLLISTNGKSDHVTQYNPQNKDNFFKPHNGTSQARVNGNHYAQLIDSPSPSQ